MCGRSCDSGGHCVVDCHVVDPEVGVPQHQPQGVGVVVEPLGHEERPTALVDVAQRHRREKHLVQGRSGKELN